MVLPDENLPFFGPISAEVWDENDTFKPKPYGETPKLSDAEAPPGGTKD